jgi:hypothetical protein
MPHLRYRIKFTTFTLVLMNGVFLFALVPATVLAQDLTAFDSALSQPLAIQSDYGWIAGLFGIALLSIGIWYVLELASEAVAVQNEPFNDANLSEPYSVVRDTLTGKPLPNSLVYAMPYNVNKPFGVSDTSGMLWHSVAPSETFRVTKNGYQATIVTQLNDPSTIYLMPLVSDTSLLLREYVFKGIKLLGLAALIWGTLLLLVIVANAPTVVFLTVMLIGYISLWLMLLQLVGPQKHSAKIINPHTNEPVRHAKVVLTHAGKARHRITNAHGIIHFAYPLPERISIIKPGFKPVTRQTVPMSSISPDEIIFLLHPEDTASLSPTRESNGRVIL